MNGAFHNDRAPLLNIFILFAESMIHLFISYGGNDREFAQNLSQAINQEFTGRITTRIIEDCNQYEAITWKQKVINDLKKSLIFIPIITSDSQSRPWPNQELGYAQSRLDNKFLSHILPVVEVAEYRNGRPVSIGLAGFITNDMDIIHYELNNPDTCINKILEEIQMLDLDSLERISNPDIAKFDEDELEILKDIMELYYERKEKSIFDRDLSQSLSNHPEKLVRDTLSLFERENILRYDTRMMKLTPLAFFRYGSYFLNINISSHCEVIFDIIASYENRDEDCTGPIIQEATDLEPIVIDFAVDILENTGYIDVHRYAGSRPFYFTDATLSTEGRREIRRRQSTNAGT